MGNHTIRDLRILGEPGNPGTGRGIRAKDVHGLALTRILIDRAPGDAISLENVDYPTLTQCRIGNDSRGRGIHMVTCFQPLLLNCTVLNVFERCLHAVTTWGLVIVGGEFSNGHIIQTGKSAEDALVDFASSHGSTFIKPAIEGFVRTNTKTAVRYTDCEGGNILGGGFTGDENFDSASVGIRLVECDGFVVGENLWAFTQSAVTIDDDCTQITAHTQFVKSRKPPASPDPGPANIVLPSISNRANKNIIVIDRQGIIPPAFKNADEPSAPPEGAFWYRTNGQKGWWGWDGTDKKQLG
jgi:hypothetical protein